MEVKLRKVTLSISLGQNQVDDIYLRATDRNISVSQAAQELLKMGTVYLKLLDEQQALKDADIIRRATALACVTETPVQKPLDVSIKQGNAPENKPQGIGGKKPHGNRKNKGD